MSWPRCRVNSLKRSEPWTHISSLPTCAWNMLMLWPRLVTGKTGSVEHVIFINRTRVQWLLKSQEMLCLLVSAIYLYFHFIKCTFSGSRLCPIRHLLSCPRCATQIPGLLTQTPGNRASGHFLLWSLPRLSLWWGCLCLIVIPPLDGALRGKKEKKNIFFSHYASVSTSLSLSQPAHLFFLIKILVCQFSLIWVYFVTHKK